MRMKFLAAALAFAAFPVAAQEKAQITLDDLHLVADLSEPVFSPDGSFVAYTVSTHNLKLDETVSDLWRVSWDGKVSQITNTPDKSENAPAFGGDILAYLSDDTKEEETQIFVMNVAGGKPRGHDH